MSEMEGDVLRRIQRWFHRAAVHAEILAQDLAEAEFHDRAFKDGIDWTPEQLAAMRRPSA